MKTWILALSLLPVSGYARGQEGCTAVAKGDPRWGQIEAQYARIERATSAKDLKQLFAVYAPDFEAHGLGGRVSTFNESAAYVQVGFDQVKENISINNLLLDLESCGPAVVKVTLLQQWSRRQVSFGKLRLYQTATVQDEIWVALGGEWKRKLVDNLRPGVWLVDLKRVDPSKPYDPDAPPYDPRGTQRN